MYLVSRISRIYYELCRAKHRVRRNSAGSKPVINNIERMPDPQDTDSVATLLACSTV